MKNIEEIKENLAAGKYNELLQKIYVDENKIEEQRERYMNALSQFEDTFGPGEAAIFSAPGRSEIGGNHTDHQHGEVLAAAINLDAIAVVRKTEDGMITLKSEEYPMIKLDTADLESRPSETGTTAALIRGMLQGSVNQGFSVGGFQAYVTSEVLIGAGLSSSAAFEILIGTIISELYNENTMDIVMKAKIGQYAENVYFGKPCGLMDQIACSSGSLVHVDFANPEYPVVETIELDLEGDGYSLCITDTKGSHADLTEDYAAVPKEMKKVASFFGKEVLRDVSMVDIIENMDAVRARCGDRAVLRAIHFINENERVRQQVAAIRKGDMDEFLNLVQESGYSSFQFLQNVYTTSDVKHQNMTLALAMSENALKDGGGVCRVHGGGFAGTIQAIVKNESVGGYSCMMDTIFGINSCSVLKVRPFGGIKVLD